MSRLPSTNEIHRSIKCTVFYCEFDSRANALARNFAAA